MKKKPKYFILDKLQSLDIDNLDEFYSSVAKEDMISRKRFYMQEYTQGFSMLHTVKTRAGTVITTKDSVTKNDPISIRSLITLPKSVVRFSRIGLPGTNMAMRVNLSLHFIPYWKLLSKQTLVTSLLINSEEAPDYKNDTYLKSITEYVPTESIEDESAFKKYLNTDDYIKRADHLAWEGKNWDLKRMLRYLPKDEQLLYTARQLLMSKSYGVDLAISKVPNKYKNDAGLNFDRLKWRRKRGRVDSSVEILIKIKNTKDYLVRPDKWWKEREIISRSLIYKKKYELAYKISSNHALTEGPEYASAEWMSGWISLSFLNDPLLAEDHFLNFYENVSYPISMARGAYWLGKTYEKLGNKEKAIKWFKEGAKYLTTYYGQLSHMKVYPNETFELSGLMNIDKNTIEKFNTSELVKIIYLLDEIDKDKYTKHILRHIALENISTGSEVLSAKLATEIGRYDFAIQISKIASYEKRFHNKYNYPIISTPKLINGRKIPESAFILSIIRQESEFDLSANSWAGAKGLMQLMPYTAKVVAKQAKLPYSKSRLTTDPEYNINLGSHYIAGLILEYDGSYPFAIAAYNAGPKRVRYWKKINKNPQKNQVDYVNWIELIKFEETRNYVQRVLENYNVYRYILEQKPIKLKNFFKNDPLY